MPLQAIESVLEAHKGGVWFLPDRVEPKAIQSAAKKAGFAFFHIEGKNITRKEQLLNHVATALQFPGHFGHNWDALEECLTDLEWPTPRATSSTTTTSTACSRRIPTSSRRWSRSCATRSPRGRKTAPR